MNNRHVALVLLCLAGTASTWAQGTRADYDRAAKLRELTGNKVFKQTLKAHWLPDNRHFWYRNELAGGAREFFLVDAEKGERKLAFDHARLAAALGRSGGKQVSADRLPVEKIDLGPDESKLFLSANGKWWFCDLRSYELTPTNRAAEAVPSLRAETRVRPSRRTGDDTSITFVNQTKEEAQIYWIAEGGERRRYGSVKPGDRYEQHTFTGHVWLVTDRAGKTLGVFEGADGGGEAIIGEASAAPQDSPAKSKPSPPKQESPKRRYEASIQENNVQLRDTQTGDLFKLTQDGTEQDGYGGRIHWSPDGARFVVLRTRKGEGRKVSIIESSPKDQLQPKLHSFDYDKPGDRIAVSKPHLFDTATRREIPIKDDLFANPWSISDLRWAADSKRFTFLFNQRGHQVLRIVAVDAQTGEARAIVDETSKTFINYSGRFFCHYLDDTREIVWMSERDGWSHLYLYDAETGRVKNQITQGDWIVRQVDQVDAKARQIWFRAGGIRAGQDPYQVHLCRVNLDGTGLTILTEGDGTHSLEYSPDRRFVIDSWSRVDQPPIHEVRRSSDGRRTCELERADWSQLLKAGWKVPERFVAKGRDGRTDIHGVIWRPTNFDPAKKYPVIEDIYAGPQGSFVPKSFRSHYRQQEMAELGFIVVQIDGMGTANRSKAFHDVCWKNLKDAGFPDRIAWLKAAAAKYPFMDLTRVGIYGGSAGGQNALGGLLHHGDFYKVGVADCGCHDNRMDKVWWNEQWMGWPIGPEYADSSNVTHAHKLQGKLMLVVGELDRNVDPASTMQVVNALEKADKDFDLLVMTGVGHGAAEGPYASRRRADFFVRHLLGVEPRVR